MKEPLGKAARNASDSRLRGGEPLPFPSLGLSRAQKRVLRRCLRLLYRLAEIDPATAQTAREAAQWHADQVEGRR
jgi:hypothetical protein